MSNENISENGSTKNDNLKKEMLKPVTESDPELEDELKDLEVKNSGGGKDGGAG